MNDPRELRNKRAKKQNGTLVDLIPKSQIFDYEFQEKKLTLCDSTCVCKQLKKLRMKSFSFHILVNAHKS